MGDVVDANVMKVHRDGTIDIVILLEGSIMLRCI